MVAALCGTESDHDRFEEVIVRSNALSSSLRVGATVLPFQPPKMYVHFGSNSATETGKMVCTMSFENLSTQRSSSLADAEEGSWHQLKVALKALYPLQLSRTLAMVPFQWSSSNELQTNSALILDRTIQERSILYAPNVFLAA